MDMMLLLESATVDCETLLDDDSIDGWEDQMFQNIVWCFNIIAEIVRVEKGLPFFDLKGNWKLLRKHKYDYVVINVREWVDEIQRL